MAFGDALRKSLDGCGFEYVRRDAWSNSRLIGRERVNPNVAVTKSAGFEQLRAKRVSLTQTTRKRPPAYGLAFTSGL